MINRASALQRTDSSFSEPVGQELTNLNSIEILEKRLKRNREARAEFVSSQIDKGIAYQLRALRDRQGLSQERLSELVGMNQNAISRLESPRYGRSTISTLKRLAAAFDVALIVRFVPFSQLVSWVSGTPFVDAGLSTESMAVPSFEEEKEKSAQIRTPNREEIAIPMPERFTNERTNLIEFRKAMTGNEKQKEGFVHFHSQEGNKASERTDRYEGNVERNKLLQDALEGNRQRAAAG